MCKVSIIVPIYNSQKYLIKCIDSLINQTYTDIEIILVNDGSTDGSGKICDEYALKDKRVRVFHKNNSGPSSSRNFGVKNAKGEYVLFVDSDDWIMINTVEKTLSELIKYDGDFLIFEMRNIIGTKIQDCKLFDEKQRIFEGKAIEQLENILLIPEKYTKETISNLTGPMCKLYKKELIEDIKFPENMNLGEDFCFFSMILRKATKIIYIDDVLYNYLVRERSLSHKIDKSLVERNATLVNWILDFYENYKNDEILNEFCFRYYCNVLCNILIDKSINIKEKKRLINRFLNLINRTKADFVNVDVTCKNKNLNIIWKLIQGNHIFTLKFLLNMVELKKRLLYK